MKHRPFPAFARDLEILYQVGSVSGLTDQELLGHFTTHDSAAAQQAFEAIVQRHGPMVLGVCRRRAGDAHAAEDAFQATFLVLALKAASIRKRDSLGPWLHGVAARISRRARVLSRRFGKRALASGRSALCASEGSEIETAELRSVVTRRSTGFQPCIAKQSCSAISKERRRKMRRELGWTKGTVSGRLARAKELLRADWPEGASRRLSRSWVSRWSSRMPWRQSRRRWLAG